MTKAMPRGRVSVRPFENRDEAAVVGVWYRSGSAAYPYLTGWNSLTVERAGKIFRTEIQARCDIWVGLHDNRVVAYLAMKGAYIESDVCRSRRMAPGLGYAVDRPRKKSLRMWTNASHASSQPGCAQALREARVLCGQDGYEPVSRVYAGCRILVEPRTRSPNPITLTETQVPAFRSRSRYHASTMTPVLRLVRWCSHARSINWRRVSSTNPILRASWAERNGAGLA